MARATVTTATKGRPGITYCWRRTYAGPLRRRNCAGRCGLHGILGQARLPGLAHPGLGFGDPRLRLLAARCSTWHWLCCGPLGTGLGHRCQCLGRRRWRFPGARGWRSVIHQNRGSAGSPARHDGLGPRLLCRAAWALGDTLLLLVEPCVEGGQADWRAFARPGLLQPRLVLRSLLDKITLIPAHPAHPRLDRWVSSTSTWAT